MPLASIPRDPGGMSREAGGLSARILSLLCPPFAGVAVAGQLRVGTDFSARKMPIAHRDPRRSVGNAVLKTS